MDNIRYVEEIKPLPEPAAEKPDAKPDAKAIEVKEILDEATAYTPTFEFIAEEPAIEPDQEEI